MPLQREFKGLSDHVGLYQAGNLPMELVGAVMPQLSVEDFISPPIITRFSGTVTAQNAVVAAVQVPDKEIHRVRWMGCSFTTAGTRTAMLTPVIFHLDNYFGIVQTPYGLPLPVTGLVNKLGTTFPGDGLFLEPGQSVGFQVTQTAGAGNIDVVGLYQHQVIGI